MVRDFEIIKLVHHHNRGLFIFARHTGADHDFCVGEGSLFGGVAIYHYTEIRFDDGVFVFRPFCMEDLFIKIFEEGQRVQLIPSSDTPQQNTSLGGRH